MERFKTNQEFFRHLRKIAGAAATLFHPVLPKHDCETFIEAIKTTIADCEKFLGKGHGADGLFATILVRGYGMDWKWSSRFDEQWFEKHIGRNGWLAAYDVEYDAEHKEWMIERARVFA